ncbi:3-hydroxybutyrate oligomer hydrolase family protein [Dyella flagellata]|uniref:D-(-)-3-hydroxybutyrate oligomer hydrolase n=1 Tax=Dyella flagellata TaxID=1867833 RepID=A0ABQ5XCN5_9GAMM|nr:3-hydroxybutyrate oligomer hydrolase family protein [Dyella flagellata]GLQ88727.1 D-(-)-3-hydroxybutyrate oligomer hydrolase [Dyella flagellata]
MQGNDFVQGEVSVTTHREHDDLLSAGLGLEGLKGPLAPFANPAQPTVQELRRRAIQTSWKGIADLGPLGGYGSVYGVVPEVPGREYQAFAKIPGARQPHRVLVQVPDHFDQAHRCLVVTASSGSRGIYGAIALAGAWGLPRGCAVAYTDKGTGSGYFDYADDSGVALNGERAKRGTAMLEFEPAAAKGEGIAFKHAHSGDNPEADWGRHVLQAARFGLAMLDRAFPDKAPFTPQNTRIIATGLSNGGGAVLQAAGRDDHHLLAGVVAIEPNVHTPNHGRALYDYATEAAMWLPCALIDARFASTPFARDAHGAPHAAWVARCASLHAQGLLQASTLEQQASEAYEHLRSSGWSDQAMATAASSTALDLWRVIGAAYASAYLRRDANSMPCGYHYAVVVNSKPGVADEATRQSWWADAAGIPPGNGIGLFGDTDEGADPQLPGITCLRKLWTGSDTDARALHASVQALAVKLPRKDLPLWVLHGADDGLLPTAFTSEPYVAWLHAEGRQPLYWKLPHAQHFDAFLALPGFGDRHLPLLPYGYAALDRLWAHLFQGQAWPTGLPVPAGTERGAGPLQASMLGL